MSTGKCAGLTGWSYSPNSQKVDADDKQRNVTIDTHGSSPPESISPMSTQRGKAYSWKTVRQTPRFRRNDRGTLQVEPRANAIPPGRNGGNYFSSRGSRFRLVFPSILTRGNGYVLRDKYNRPFRGTCQKLLRFPAPLSIRAFAMLPREEGKIPPLIDVDVR